MFQRYETRLRSRTQSPRELPEPKPWLEKLRWKRTSGMSIQTHTSIERRTKLIGSLIIFLCLRFEPERHRKCIVETVTSFPFSHIYSPPLGLFLSFGLPRRPYYGRKKSEQRFLKTEEEKVADEYIERNQSLTTEGRKVTVVSSSTEVDCPYLCMRL